MIRIVHISDLHYKKDYNEVNNPFREILTLVDDPLKQLERTFENIDKNFDLVIVSGDICEYGSVEDYTIVKNFLNDYFKCPIIVTSGNHDNRRNLNMAFFGKDSDEIVFDVWKNEPLKIISFDSSDPKYNDGFITLETIKKLDEELSDGIKTIVFTHHHLLNDQFAMKRAENSDALLECLNKYDNIVAILTGHTHHFYNGSVNDTLYITTEAMSFKVDGIDGSLIGYQDSAANIYEYEDGKLTVKKIECPDKKEEICLIKC